MDFLEAVKNSSSILTEGAFIERLRRDPEIHLDPHIEHAALIYDAHGNANLARLYRQYLDIGRAFGLPMVVFTPTWRASPARLSAAGFFNTAQVNRDGFAFVSAIRESYGSYADRIYIGGLTGCRGDAYRPEESLSEEEATAYHRPQVQALSDAGADFLMAATLPAVTEAVGIARAMAGCGIPYLLSFPVRPTGTLLDETPLYEAISRIDSMADPLPFGYMVNCVHPTVFAEALERAIGQCPEIRERVVGLQANTSTLSPEELDNLDHLDEGDDPETFAEAMLNVWQRFGLRILGGCCGTDERHIRRIAEGMKPGR